MSNLKLIGLFFTSLMFLGYLAIGQNKGVSFKHKEAAQEVEIWINGKYFSSYLYHDALKKPVLYPLKTVSNKVITRGFPVDAKPGERIDHPHHLGYWFNYGNVNGFDFWNNSSARPADQKHKFGEIRHTKLSMIEGGKKSGTLAYEANWVDPTGKVLLVEKTRFVFREKGGTRTIDRETILEAQTDVSFTDNKEGMIGLRLTRALELPSANKPALFTDSEGKPMTEKSLSPQAATADYLSSEGGTGKEVWGTRAKWMKLHGKLDGSNVEIVMLDHPGNVGYPTYWHARDYGLFSANPLGQAIFSKGKETLNYALSKGKSVSFKYRLLIHEGKALSTSAIEKHQGKKW